MMYLLTRGWSLTHISLAMKPEQPAMSEEYYSLSFARAVHSRAVHSRRICLSSPKAPVRHNLQIRLLRGRLVCLPCSMGKIGTPRKI